MRYVSFLVHSGLHVVWLPSSVSRRAAIGTAVGSITRERESCFCSLLLLASSQLSSNFSPFFLCLFSFSPSLSSPPSSLSLFSLPLLLPHSPFFTFSPLPSFPIQTAPMSNCMSARVPTTRNGYTATQMGPSTEWSLDVGSTTSWTEKPWSTYYWIPRPGQRTWCLVSH